MMLAGDVTVPKADRRSRSWLWDAGERHRVQDVDFSVPPSTETLFAVCASHARVEWLPNMQWILDAKMVMQTPIDWERVVVLAEQSGQAPRLYDALDFLARLPGPKPPQEVCERLAAIPVSRRLRLSYRCTIGATRGPARLQALVGEHLAHSRPFGSRSRRSPSTLAAGSLGLARTRDVPVAAGKRVVRLVGHRERAT